jgi:ABC-type Fe3+/spermidine/putrescine transport system ATPase subunit
VIVELDGVTHRYDGEAAVEDVSFGVESGELVALLGPSGCGKTTLVHAIAGHIHPTAGRIRLRGRDVTDDPPESRRIGLVFQESTLYPHMTASENVAYGVAAHEDDPERRAATVTEYLDLVALSDQRDASPGGLSGGQRRRVELARALAPEPDLLVLDEPLSALDRALRTQLREVIARIHRETGVATLFVTHDQRDAMAVADRLVVMTGGRVAATGTPRALYESPPTPFVASFLGRSTAVSGRLVATDPPRVAVGEREIRVDAVAGDRQPGDRVTCHVRPRALNLGGDSDPDRSLYGEVTAVADVGHHYDVSIRVAPDDELRVECTAAPPGVGESVAIEFPDTGVTLFDPGFEPSTAANPGPMIRSEDGAE